MISRSLSSHCKKPHQSITHSLFTQKPSLIFTVPLSTLPSSATNTNNNNNNNHVYKLDHKDWLSPNEILKIFNNLKDPNSIIPVLNQYSNRKDYKPTEPLYTLVINKLAMAKNFDAIETLMKTIKHQMGFRFSDDFFYNLIKIYGHLAGRIDKAIHTLYDMPNYSCFPSVKTFNFVLNLLVSEKLFDAVYKVYVRAPVLGVEIDSCCLNILIKGLCGSGNLSAAFYVLDEFPKQKCRPNVRTFSTLMHGLCDSGKVEEAFGLFERMEREGIDPDTIMFNILISGLRKQGRVEEGMELLERMKHKGCYPNSGSYLEVLYGLLDAKKFVEAKGFMGRMIFEGLKPSFLAYKILIQGLCKEKLVGDVDWVLKQMVQQGFVPKMGMWRVIVRSVFSRNSICNCISLDEIIE